jgi:hypothetical protein
MRPGDIHIVYTLQDSIVIGGHFYSDSTFRLSMMVGLHEHRFGRYSTNTEHLGGASILYRYIRYLQHCIDNWEKGLAPGGQSFTCVYVLCPSDKIIFSYVKHAQP